jgi:hypothetical protein
VAFSAANFLNEAAFGALPPIEFTKAAMPSLVAGRAHSLAYLAGIPGPMAAPTPGLAGAALTSYPGALAFPDPGALEARLMRLQAQANSGGTVMLCDRLWHNSGLNLTLTTAQAVNSVPFAARDANNSANGDSVLIGLEISTITGAGVPTLTLGYTAADGTAGRTASNIIATAASSPVGALYQFGVAGADKGVRSIQSAQLSATWTSGVAHLVAYRVLARLELTSPGFTGAIDVLTGGNVKGWPGTVPFIVWIPAQTTTTPVVGHMIWTRG